MKLNFDFGLQSYSVIIKQGALGRACQLAHLGERVLCVTDSGVPEKYVKTLLKQCRNPVLHVLPQGPAAKSLEAYTAMVSHMLEEGFCPGDAVAALGGGAVADAAGFAAATYRQGLRLYQFPTTTAAQLGAATAGRTALDLTGTPNALGMSYQPSLVVCDPAPLATLPARYRAAGLAEALGCALAGSAALFAILEREDIAANWERILYLCLEHRRCLLESDPGYERQARLLDFGQPVGRCIEQAGGLLYGECLALGMLPMIENQTLLQRAKKVMAKIGLPLSQPHSAEALMRFMQPNASGYGQSVLAARVKTLGQAYLERLEFEELQLLLKACMMPPPS